MNTYPSDMTEADPRSLLDELYGMPGHLVRRVQQSHSAIFAEECGPHDLTSVQFAALIAIEDNPGTDATRLSAVIAFDRSTLGDVLERLEAKGWIVRKPHMGNRRMKLLQLTESGAAVVRGVLPAVRRVQERLLAPLGPQDRAMLLNLLGKIAEFHNGVGPRLPRPASDESASD